MPPAFSISVSALLLLLLLRPPLLTTYQPPVFSKAYTAYKVSVGTPARE